MPAPADSPGFLGQKTEGKLTAMLTAKLFA
jgi:hypothetical protein